MTKETEKALRQEGPKQPKRRATQKEKTLRAFGAYLELLDTAAWLKSWMYGPLASMDLTIQGFRLLVLLYRDGPTPMVEAARQMRFPRQNLEYVLRRLEKRGWVCRENVRAAARPKRTREEKNVRRTGVRPAWQFKTIRLTEQGEKFVGQVFPRHAKVVKALMRALDGREQETLGEICRKLRAGHILKFASEITHPDDWEIYYERDEKLEGALQRTEPEETEDQEVEQVKPPVWEPTPPPGRARKRKRVAETEQPRQESRPWMQPGVKKQPIMTFDLEEWARRDAEELKRREEEYKREHPEEYVDDKGS